MTANAARAPRTNCRYSEATVRTLRGRQADFEIYATLRTVQRVILRYGILESDDSTFTDVLAGRRALLIVDNGFFRLYREQLGALALRSDDSIRVVGCNFSETEKSVTAAYDLIREFERIGVGRRDVVVAVGGGVCCDVVSFAASVYRRGIQHIKVPTTLLGVVDAGIGSKNAVNIEGAKNRIGAFFPPECSILDPSFSRRQRYSDFRCGVAEMLKVAIVRSGSLFDRIEAVANESGFPVDVMYELSSQPIIEIAVAELLQELAIDLYEVGDLRRAADFGHSFSPELEVAFGGKLAHGDAVAVEMLVLAEVSALLGFIDDLYLRRIYTLYDRLRLPMMISPLDSRIIWLGLRKASQHRGGHVNMPLPFACPGRHVIISDLETLDCDLFDQALRSLESRLGDGVVLEPA